MHLWSLTGREARRPQIMDGEEVTISVNSRMALKLFGEGSSGDRLGHVMTIGNVAGEGGFATVTAPGSKRG